MGRHALPAARFWGFVFRADLPVAWHALSMRAIGMLAAGAVLTVIGYRYSPALTARSEPVILARRSQDFRAAQCTRNVLGSLHGRPPHSLARMVRHRDDVKRSRRHASHLCCRLQSLHGSLKRPASLHLLLPFSGDSASVLFGAQADPLLWLLLLMIVGIRGGYRPMIRHFRALPLSTVQLNALLISTPVIDWANAWLVLFVVQLICVGHLPASLRPDLFVGLVGLSALNHRRRDAMATRLVGAIDCRRAFHVRPRRRCIPRHRNECGASKPASGNLHCRASRNRCRWRPELADAPAID